MYRYELHCHTSVVSRCSRLDPADAVKLYLSLGYDGVFVTDHFINGNSVVPSHLDYAEQIRLYAKGYEAVKKAAEGTPLKVFFGVEYSFKGTDFLIYGLDPEWYIAHPEVKKTKVRDAMQLVRESGGAVFHAHPMREDWYIDHVRLYPRAVDGIETYNACRSELENKFADVYADLYGFCKICGSDIHYLETPQLACFETEEPIETERDVLKFAKSGKSRIVKLENPFAKRPE